MSKANSGKQHTAPSSALHKQGITQVILWGVALFLLISLSGIMDNTLEKFCALLAAVTILGISFSKSFDERLKETACPAFFAVLSYVALGGISTFYAVAGKFAISEFSKLLIAFCVYLLVIARTQRTVAGFRRVATIFSSVACAFGILSVDAASAGLFARIFKGIFGLFTRSYAETGAYQEGVRISTIFGNANIYAGFMAIAVLLSVSLVLGSKTRGEHCVSAFLLGMNALCYLLAFSIGSLFMCVLAAVLMVLFTKKGNRAGMLILLAETVAVTLITTGLSMIGLGKAGVLGFIPLVAVILSGTLLWILDNAVRHRFSEMLNKNARLFVGLILGIILLAAIYLAVGFRVTGAAVLSGGETLSRSIYPAPGQYTMTVDASQPLTVTIAAQNKFDLMKRTSTTAYAGTSEGEIAFTVPDGTKIVTITMTAADKTTVSSASYTGAAGTKALPLKYKLLPAIIANRLQNLGANENAVQRTVFFEDGLKMFKTSPIFGRGMGGFENGVFSVQDFFYETKYAHNHYIQVLADLGIMGLALFLAVLGFAGFTLWQGRKNEEFTVLIPVLSACLLQMAGQGATDVIWSAGAFLPFAFAILALIVVFFGKPFTLKKKANKDTKPKGNNKVHAALKYGICGFSALFLLLISGNLYAKALVNGKNVNLDTLKTCMAADVFEKNDYILSYVVSAPETKDETVKKLAKSYAEKLSRVQSNSIQNSLVDYYFKIGEEDKAFEVAMKGIAYTKSSPAAWSKQFDSFEKAFDPVATGTMDLSRVEKKDYYTKKILSAYTMLQETNKKQLDDLLLTPKNNAFLGKIMAIRPMASDDLAGALSVLSKVVFDSKNAADANSDLVPDAATTVSGNVKWVADGCTVTGPAAIYVETWHKTAGDYRISVACDNPKNVTGISVQGTALPMQYEAGEAFAVAQLSNNDFSSPLPIQIDFSNTVQISQITVKK